jgi:hypothetical protein
MQDWHGTRDRVVRDTVRTTLYKETRKDGRFGGDNRHTRKAALEHGTET